MTELLHRAGALSAPGVSLEVTPAIAGWEFSGLTILDFEQPESRELALAGHEAAVLPLTTGCVVEVGGHRFDLAGRSSVFGQLTDWSYITTGEPFRVSATGPGEIALCTAAASRHIDPYYVPAEEVAVEVRGGGAGTRQINNFLSADVHDADTLIGVEVITPENNWSSFPPHKHDEFSDDEVPLEEIYYFRFSRPQGVGMFGLYTADGDIDFTDRIDHGDVVLVPRGYHGPAGAPPGYHMYYLNVMAGPSTDRVWKFTDDPRHAWARPMIDAMPPDARLPLTT